MKEFKNIFLTISGDLRSFIRVYVGDEDINELEGTNTKIDDRDEVIIIPAIAGGSK